MSEVTLTGQLLCADEAEAAIVRRCLPVHIELTLAEAGCISFEVTETSDPLVWQVDERFVDAAAFATHQARVRASDWGKATTAIKRSYQISGLAESDPGVENS